MQVRILLLLFLAFLSSTTVFGCGRRRRKGGSKGGSSGGSGGTSVADIRESIASTAEKYVGSTRWCYQCSSGHGANTYKCNYFVYDVGIEAGAKMPTRKYSWRGGPVGAGVGGWGTASSLKYWTPVSSTQRQRGDIVAAKYWNGDAYHVGIYVAYKTTVSANDKDVGRNNWPYDGCCTGIVYWRYTG